MGLSSAAEAFADRAYEPDGILRSRTLAGALLDDPARAAQQALDIATRHVTVATDGSELKVTADTICIHSDTPGSVAIARAVKAVEPRLGLLAPTGTKLETAGLAQGLAVAREIYADRAYTDAGLLVERSCPGAVLHDAGDAAARVLAMVSEGAIITISGKRVVAGIDSICVHGDGPNAVAIAKAVRARLEKASIDKSGRDHEQSLINETIADLDDVLRMFSSLTRISQIETTNKTSAFRTVDLAEIEVPEIRTEALTREEIERRIATRLGRKIVVVGACTGADAHTVAWQSFCHVLMSTNEFLYLN